MSDNPKFTPRRLWALWGSGNIAASAFMVTGISESLIGFANAIFAGAFLVAGIWLLYCAYHMEVSE